MPLVVPVADTRTKTGKPPTMSHAKPELVAELITPAVKGNERDRGYRRLFDILAGPRTHRHVRTSNGERSKTMAPGKKPVTLQPATPEQMAEAAEKQKATDAAAGTSAPTKATKAKKEKEAKPAKPAGPSVFSLPVSAVARALGQVTEEKVGVIADFITSKGIKLDADTITRQALRARRMIQPGYEQTYFKLAAVPTLTKENLDEFAAFVKARPAPAEKPAKVAKAPKPAPATPVAAPATPVAAPATSAPTTQAPTTPAPTK